MFQKLKEFLKDYLYYGVITSASALLGFFLLPFYTRMFSPDEYGIIELITISISFVNVFVLLNLNSAVMRYFYEYKRNEERRVMISTLLTVILCSGAAVSISVLFFAGGLSVFLFKTDRYGTSMIIASVIVILSAVYQYLMVILRLERWKKEFGISQIGFFTVTIGLVIALVSSSADKVEAVFFAQMLGYALFVFYGLWVCRRHIRGTFSSAMLKKAFRYSLPMLPAVAANWANGSVNRYFIFNYLGAFGVGIFAVGARLSMGMLLLVEAFRLGWGPFAMSLIGDRDQKLIYGRMLSYYIFFMLLLASVLTLFSREFVHFISEEQYHDSYRVVGLLAGSFVLYGAFTITSISSLMTERTYLKSIAIILGLTVNIVLMVVLLPVSGIMGVAIAAFVGACVLNIIMLFFTKVYYPIKFDLSRISAALIGYILISVISMMKEDHSFGLKLFVIAIYCCVIYILLDSEFKIKMKDVCFKHLKAIFR